MRLQYSPLGFGLIAVLFSCSESSYELSRSEDAAWADTGYYGAEAGDADADTDVDADEDSDGWEPEAEDDFLKLMPATTDAYVFVANPGRNTVTRISVPSLDVITAEVGDNPTSVSTTDDYTLAVTFNADSDDVSIIESETLEVTTVTVLDDLNTMKMSPTGDWVVVYHDVDSQEEDTTEGVVSYKQVSFVNLASGEHTPLVVGFKPEDIQFTDDGELALVVGDAYLALVDLTADELSVDLVQISDDLVNPDEAEEVVLVPDGSYAFVRQFGAEELVLVDLAAQAIDYLPVGS
ncbi:MAG: hypothetical protein QGG40_16505, partial [Myxococcota bacterium]|nr:hypothetical protein [Myxococcota bacterium]